MKLTDEEISRRLPDIAKKCREVIQRELGDDCAMVLMLQPWREIGAPETEQRGFQYISNAPREFIKEAMRTMVANWDAGHGPAPHNRQ